MADARHQADVLVVGSGGAALAAAIAASDGGAAVTVVEKSDQLGGTTAVSGGGIWMPCNDHMGEVGATDSREEARAYMERLTAGRTPAELIDTFLAEGPAVLRRLEDTTPLRLAPMSWPDYHPEMEGAKASGRMLEPRPTALGELPVRRAPVLGLPMTLQESTVEWRPSYTPERFDAAAVQQRVDQGVVTCGRALVAALLQACVRRGVRIVTRTAVRELVVEQGRVVGAVADGARFDARSVVLATGGFEWNEELKSRFLAAPLTHPTTPPVNEGDGLVMAMEVGADLGNMTEAWWYPAASVPGESYDGRPLSRFLGPERTAPHTIIVNRFGERFVNEAANYNDMAKAFVHFDANLYANRNLPCWVVFDHRYRSRYAVLTTRPGAPDPDWLLIDESLAGLADRAGIDGDRLEGTIRRWNGFVRAGRDLDFGRGDSLYDRFHGDPTAPHPTLGTIEEPPFYALPVHAGAVGTKGGPRVSARGEVMHVRDRPIPGLYAAGNVIASPAGPAYFGGGTSIAMGLVWGWLGGTHAAGRAG